MGVVMKQFIDRFKAMEKIANETLAENPEALVGVSTMPGSEHDQKVPQEAKKPDPEVAQGQPAGAESAAGAVNGGDAKPLNEGKLEMDQPLENPEQKPLISDDALTAKTANEHLISLVGDLLADIKSNQKQASCGGEGATHAAAPAKGAAPAKKEPAKSTDGKPNGEEKKAEKSTQKITLDDETISKLAAAQATFMLGRAAAEKVLQKSAGNNGEFTPEAARALIKESCIKAAQEQGMDPAAAAAAADNAMAIAGMPPAEAAAAGDAAGAETAAADAGAAADEAAADAGAAEAALPEDVTEEELATAIVDLVQSGDLDVDTAKAIVEEIAGDEGSAGPTEDQAAEIIAQGLESGEITPEQAQQIAAEVEGGGASADAGAAGDGAAAADADAAAGAADAAAAVQDANDEAAGEKLAEEAIKIAAAKARSDAFAKVANAIVAKREEKRAAATPGFRVMSKVAGILKAKKEAQEQANAKTQKQASAEDRYIAGFVKKAQELGVDPKALAKYICDRQASEQAKK